MHPRAKPLLFVALAAVAAAGTALVVIVPRLDGSSADTAVIQGDVDCNEEVDAVDALFVLRFAVQLQPYASCLETAGDVDCNGAVDAIDALGILRFLTGLPALPRAAGSAECLPIGEPVGGTPTASATAAATPSPTASPTETPRAGRYSLEPFLASVAFNQIVDFAVIPGRTDEAVVITQKDAKLFRVSLSGAFTPVLFGDLASRAGGGGTEEGLLSLAFSPDFQTDGRVYVYYTPGSPQPSILSRFQASSTDLNEASERVILEVPQPYSNHNGGRLLFGPDGYLYLSLGDGGGGGDPLATGQDNADLLASLLRIDVSGQTTYAVPPDNPFVGRAGADEVWAYGLRNPWRYSFDRLTGDLWLGDVGQSTWEEVDLIARGGNYGWNVMEGFACYPPSTSICDQIGLQLPRAVYRTHEDGSCAITGGYVYRGAALPELYGWYVYGDFCNGRIWALNTADSSSPPALLTDSGHLIPSFAELPDGELLVLTFENAILRLVRR